MASKFRVAALVIACVLGAGGWDAGVAQAQDAPAASAQSPTTDASTADKPAIPPYHASTAHVVMPATLDPLQFQDDEARNIYALAAKIKRVLYQEPCYCGCDKEVGHKSLLDCYTDRHGSFCAVCKKEAVYSYDQTRKGQIPAQIRKEIIDGDWASVDLAAYDKAATVK